MHTTNYRNTLIEIAEDCPMVQGVCPPHKPEAPSIAHLQYALIQSYPYTFTSDEILFKVYYQKQQMAVSPDQAWADFFGRPQACLRTSPLSRRYGWGIHANDKGKIALLDAASDAYQQLLADPNIKKVKAMRSRRATKI